MCTNGNGDAIVYTLKASSDLDLNAAHSQYVVDYLRYVRHKRNLSIKSIEGAFKDVEESRLVESTFTCDEVEQILSGLCGVIKADIQSELIATAHTNVLLLRQMFKEGEKWRINLQVDISDLENRYI